MMSAVTSELDLQEIRRRIDDVDAKILALFAERVELVLEVGRYKRERNLAVYDPDRERKVLERLTELAPAGLSPQVIRRVFERIIDESRRIEQHDV